jgi:hypothetical protein
MSRAFNEKGHPIEGGRGTSPMYDRMRARGASLRDRLEGAAARIRSGAQSFGGGGAQSYGGGGSQSYGGGSTRQRQSRQSQRIELPATRTRYKDVFGVNPLQANDLWGAPTTMIPRAVKGLDPRSPEYAHLANLPAAEMAMLMGGKGGGLGTTTTLRGQKDPSYTDRGAYRAGRPGTNVTTVRASGPGAALARNLPTLYGRAAEKGWLPSTGRMLRNLGSSGVTDELFGGVAYDERGAEQRMRHGRMPLTYESSTVKGYEAGREPMPVGTARTTLMGLLDAALYSEPTAVGMKYGSTGWGGYLADRGGGRALGQPPGRGRTLNRTLTSRLFR